MEKVNYNHLHYFNIIATEGSISSAAQKLQLSPSTLSEQLRQLEDSFGTQLFDRENSQLRLNEAGLKMYLFTKIMFRAGDRLIQAFDPSKLTDKITLDIGVASSVSKIFAAKYLKPLLNYPEVLVRVKQGDYEYLIRDLHSFQLDILLSDQHPDDMRHEGIVTEVVQESPLILVAKSDRKDLVKIYRDKQTSFPFINYSIHSDFRWNIDRYFEQSGREPDVLGEMEDVSLMKLAVNEGIALAALPKKIIENELIAGTFEQLDVIQGNNTKVFISYHQKTPMEHVTRAVQIFKGKLG